MAASSSVHGCPSGSHQAISAELQKELEDHFKCCREGSCKEKYEHLSPSAKTAVHKLFCHQIIFNAMRAIEVHESTVAPSKNEITEASLSALKIDRLIEGVFDFDDVIPKDTDSHESKYKFAKQLSYEANHAFEALGKAERENVNHIYWHLMRLWFVSVDSGPIHNGSVHMFTVSPS